MTSSLGASPMRRTHIWAWLCGSPLPARWRRSNIIENATAQGREADGIRATDETLHLSSNELV